MNKVWKSKLDDKYDVFVESSDNKPYEGFLVIKKGKEKLFREKTSISYGAKFGPDIGDIAIWETTCADFIDKLVI